MAPASSEKRALVDELVARGERPRAACRTAGISENTYYRWLRHGRAALAKQAGGYTLTPAEATFVAFLVAITQATWTGAIRTVARVGIA